MLTRIVAAGLGTLTIFMFGCGKANTITGPAETLVGELVRGSISDSARRPLAGARVEVVNGPQAGVWTITDSNGEFALRATVDDTTQFRAIKEGHVTAVQIVNPSCAACNPHRWIHMILDPTEGSVDLAGTYMLTMTAAPVCSMLPAEVRTRSYTAVVAARPADHAFIAEIGGASFLPGYERMWLLAAGDYFRVEFGDHGDPGFVERLKETTFLGFEGAGVGTIGAGASEISVAFDGMVDYCVLNGEMGSRYGCNPPQAIAHVQCRSEGHRLTLSRTHR